MSEEFTGTPPGDHAGADETPPDGGSGASTQGPVPTEPGTSAPQAAGTPVAWPVVGSPAAGEGSGQAASVARAAGPGAGPPAGAPWPYPVVGADLGGAGDTSRPGSTGGAPWTAGADTPPAGAPTAPGRGIRSWLLVAVVAALIGAGVGATVTWATDRQSTGSTITVNEGRAAPGAAMVSGSVSIPSLVNKVLPATVSIDVKYGTEEDQGTGMIISSTGEVVTNNHVIALASSGGTITVTESGTTTTHPASLIGTDPSSDVALLQIKGVSKLPTVTFGDSNKAVVGDAVVAIGNALGLEAGTPTVTQGIVSALGRTVTAGDEASAGTETLTNMIQTDAAINPGNSGGPLIDTAAQVIGMNTAVAGSTSDGTSAQDIGFAIPAAKIEALLPQLQKGGTVQTGGAALGVNVTTLTPQLRQQYGFTPTSGAVVLSVVPKSPAEAAGIREGDVIVSVDSTAITSAEQLVTVIQGHKPGDKVQITYYVGDIKRTSTVTLESQSAEEHQSSSPFTIGGGTTTTGGGTGGTATGGSSGANPFGGL